VARNQFALQDLLEEGIEAWRVWEVWVMSHNAQDHVVDVTETVDKKIAALHAHVSQTAHNPELETMVRAWGERNAEAHGLPQGRVAEVFRIVNTN